MTQTLSPAMEHNVQIPVRILRQIAGTSHHLSEALIPISIFKGDLSRQVIVRHSETVPPGSYARVQVPGHQSLRPGGLPIASLVDIVSEDTAFAFARDLCQPLDGSFLILVQQHSAIRLRDGVRGVFAQGTDEVVRHHDLWWACAIQSQGTSAQSDTLVIEPKWRVVLTDSEDAALKSAILSLANGTFNQSSMIEVSPGLEKLLTWANHPDVDHIRRKRVLKGAGELLYAAIDIEGDEHVVREIAVALASPQKTISIECPPTVESRPMFAHLTSGRFVVGHNVRRHDAPVLRSHGFVCDEPLEDTLERECLLNPLRYSYALKTVHHAREDAELTLKLAQNQYLRQNLPTRFSERDQEASNRFFLDRKTPWWMDIVFTHREGGGRILFLGPSEYADFISLPPLLQVLAPTCGIENVVPAGNDGDIGLGTELLERFASEVRRFGFDPVPEHAPRYIQQYWHLPHASTWSQLPRNSGAAFCSFQNWLQPEARTAIAEWNPDTVHVLSPKLVPHDTRTRLASGERTQIASVMRKESLWYGMSGGRSAVEITAEQAVQLLHGLGAAIPTANYSRYWIEQTSRGTFEVWANAERIQHGMLPEARWKSHYLNEVSAAKTAPWYGVIGSGRNADAQRRPGPSARHRSEYWAWLGPALESLCENRLCLFAVSDPAEVDAVSRFISNCPNLTYHSRPEQGWNDSSMRRLATYGRGVAIMSWGELTRLVPLPLPTRVRVIIEALPEATPHFNGLHRVQHDDLPIVTDLDADAEDLSEEEGNLGREPEWAPSNEQNETPALEAEVSIASIQEILGWLFYDKADLVCTDPSISALSGLGIQAPIRIPDWSDERVSAYRKLAENAFPQRKRETPQDDLAESVWRPMLEKAFLPQGKQFHTEQITHLRSIMKREQDVVVSLPTGFGKSVVFQGPALYRGHLTGGLTVVVSPLKALITEQTRKLWERGFITSVEGLTSDLIYSEIQSVYGRIAGGETLLVYTAPERFRSAAFRSALETRLARDGATEFWVFDEAHCITLWGLDFRPDYQRAGHFVADHREYANDVAPVIALSATLTEQARLGLQQMRLLREDLEDAG